MDFKPHSNLGDFPIKRVSLFVEEPELSLFPDAQLELMDYLVDSCFLSHSSTYSMALMIATHSPYIVNYLNVIIARNKQSDRVAETIPAGNDSTSISMRGEDIAVYRVYDGEIQNLMAGVDLGGRWVNTYDLSEPMGNILNEYQRLKYNV